MASVDGRIIALNLGLKDGTEYISSIKNKSMLHAKLDLVGLSQARLCACACYINSRARARAGGGGGCQRVRR